MKTALFIVLTGMIITSCNVIQVSKDGPNITPIKCAGIPFYVQKEVTRQETRYLYNWLEISLTEVDEKQSAKSKNALTWRLIPDENLLKYLATFMSSPKLTEEMLKSFRETMERGKMPKLNPTQEDIKQVVSNTWKPELVVDYTQKYYLNAQKPLFGTSTITQKLAANGTLSESSATSESKLGEIAVAAIGLATPYSAIKVAQITAAAAMIAMDEAIQKGVTDTKDIKSSKLSPEIKEFQYTISIREAGYVYTFVKYHDNHSSTNGFPALEANLSDGIFSRTNWSTAEPKQEENKNAIKVEGTIILPEIKKE